MSSDVKWRPVTSSTPGIKLPVERERERVVGVREVFTMGEDNININFVREVAGEHEQ